MSHCDNCSSRDYTLFSFISDFTFSTFSLSLFLSNSINLSLYLSFYSISLFLFYLSFLFISLSDSFSLSKIFSLVYIFALHSVIKFRFYVGIFAYKQLSLEQLLLETFKMLQVVSFLITAVFYPISKQDLIMPRKSSSPQRRVEPRRLSFTEVKCVINTLSCPHC